MYSSVVVELERIYIAVRMGQVGNETSSSGSDDKDSQKLRVYERSQ